MPITRQEVQVKKEEPIIKNEAKEQTPDNARSHSSIAQFLKSGQAAFSVVDTRSLEDSKGTSTEVQKWMLKQIRDKLATATELYHDDVLILRPLLALEYMSDVTGLHGLYAELSRLLKSNLTYAVAFTNGVLEDSTSQFPRALRDDLLRNVAQDMATVSIDMRDRKSIHRQLEAFNQGLHPTGAPVPQPLPKASPAALGLFTKHFYGSGLFKPVESMLLHLRSEMDHALLIDLHILYVPFLQELISLMLIYGVPMSNATYGGFFESVLQNYFEGVVGQESKSTDNGEHGPWVLRAESALRALEVFDHSYFRGILGERYDVIVLPALFKLQAESRA